MSSKHSNFARVMEMFSDRIVATFSSLWPRSTASIEASRLVNDGYPAGQACDVHFLISFDQAMPDAASTAIRAGGFSVREQNGSSSGFVTARATVRLTAWDLSIAGARLDRIVEDFDGFATVIGAARPATEEAARPVRVASRSVAAV